NLAVSALTAAEKAQVAGPVNVGDRIQFAVAGTIKMVGPYPTLTKPLEIVGPAETGTAPGGLTIDGGDLFRIFQVAAGADVGLAGLTLVNGKTVGNGGAVLNDGTLRLFHCLVRDCHANWGGGIENNGTLTVTACYLKGNGAGIYGGGIDNNKTATIDASTLEA